MGVINQGLKGYGYIDYWIILGYMVVWPTSYMVLWLRINGGYRL
jgi:hypothetical protein